MSQPQLLTTREAAVFIGVSYNTLKCSRSRGFVFRGVEPPIHIKLGTAVRYRIQDLEDWLNTVTSSKSPSA